MHEKKLCNHHILSETRSRNSVMPHLWRVGVGHIKRRLEPGPKNTLAFLVL